MMGKSKIEWTDQVWNPVTGCTKVSEGCRNCYAKRQALMHQKHPNPKVSHRYRNGFKVTLQEDKLGEPRRWQKPRKVFVCSMADLFHEDVPDGYITYVFAAMSQCPHHTFQVLTKRASRMEKWFSNEGRHLEMTRCFRNFVNYTKPVGPWPLPNVHLGVSIEDQATADERIPDLLGTPAAVRFVSYEPALGPLNFSKVPGFNLCGQAGLDLLKNFWVIMGGESGPGARPMHPAWARSVRDQCVAAGVPFLFKQWGEWGPIRNARIDDLLDSRREVIVLPSGGLTSGLLSYSETDWVMRRVGKKAAGRTLDGVVWDQYPELK